MLTHSRHARFAALMACAIAGIGMVGARSAQADVILSYWSFNNLSKAFGGMLTGSQNGGSFSTTAATYGEQYTVGSGFSNSHAVGAQLSSNTAVGAVYTGSNVYMDPSVVWAKGTYDTNNLWTTSNDWGYCAGYDGLPTAPKISTVNSTGSGGNGSILVMGGGNNLVDFHLTSAGYDNLTLSFDAAAVALGGTGNDNYTHGGYSLQYSTDAGKTFTTFTTGTDVHIAGAAFANQSYTLPSALNDQQSFILRVNTIQETGSSTFAVELDNMKLTGVSVPEPATGLLLLAGGALMLGKRSRRDA